MPRATGRYSGCYARATVSGDCSDHTLASDARLHTALWAPVVSNIVCQLQPAVTYE
jgi:hypothetical protein